RPIVIVDIDEESLATYGQWPWPRTVLADLIRRLYALDMVAVAFDVVFSEPDRSSPGEAVKYFHDVDEGIRERLSQLPSNDDVFADVIGRGKVVLGQSGTHSIKQQPAEGVPEPGIAILGPDPAPYLISFPHLLRNLPVLERAAAGRGLFSIGTE